MNQHINQLDISIIAATFESDDAKKKLLSSRTMIKVNGVKLGRVQSVRLDASYNEPDGHATIQVVRTPENAQHLDLLKNEFPGVTVIEVDTVGKLAPPMLP